MNFLQINKKTRAAAQYAAALILWEGKLCYERVCNRLG